MLIWLGKQMLEQADAPTVAIQNNIETRALKEQQTREEDEKFKMACEGLLPPSSERDAAFIEMHNRVKAEMPPPTREQSLNWKDDGV